MTAGRVALGIGFVGAALLVIVVAQLAWQYLLDPNCFYDWSPGYAGSRSVLLGPVAGRGLT